jgi:hypothetical protein
MTRAMTLLVALLATGLIAAGCGGDEEDTTGSGAGTGNGTAEMQADPGEGAKTGAAQLRADLTYLLEEHVYLAGIAVKNGVDNGLDSGEFEAASNTLDANSKGLADAIGSVYGDDAGKQFLALWRDHIGFFVDYTKGRATDDEDLARSAQQDLDGYREEFGAFISSAVPSLPADAVAEELDPHVKSLSAAIDAVVAGDADAFDKLREAAGHMPGTAATLAGGIASENEEQFSGSTDAGAAELRANLTAALTEHVYLAGIAVSQGVGEGTDSGAFEAAAATLDENSNALADAIGSVYGDDAGKQFLALWRDHIGFFVDYTEAKAGGDEQAAMKAQEKLDGYRAEFGAFIESANPELPADAVAEELDPHVKSLSAAIDAVVAGDADAFDKLREAAGHMPGTAETLAHGIATQMPDEFPSS